MNDAKLYNSSNVLSRGDAVDVLDEYGHLINWKENGDDVILDIGCGSGNITCEVLLPRLPESFKKLVGVDLAKEMIEYANLNYLLPKVEFTVMDVGSPNIPDTYKEVFTFIFSNYCFNWVQDQRQAMENVFNLLKPGGDVLFLLSAENHPLVEGFLRMSERDEWKEYMQDVQNYINPYHHVQDAAGDVKKLMLDIGFQVKLCQGKEKQYIYNGVGYTKGLLASLHPFYKRIPENLKEKYVDDVFAVTNQIVEETRKARNVDIKHEDDTVPWLYKVVIISATKPM